MEVILFLVGVIVAVLFVGVVLQIGHWVQRRVGVLHDPVYVPTPPNVVEKILKLAKIQPGMKAVDLGSGDGRIVKALAERGVEAHGLEIHPWLVWKSRTLLRDSNLEQLTTIKWQSFWNVTYHEYDLVVLYTTAQIMPELEKKLWTELPVGAQVISYHFQFPTWKPHLSSDDIHVYQKV